MSSATFVPVIPGFRSETAHVDGIRIHYWIGGHPNGTPVLLWHGFLGTSFVWRHVMSLLAETGFAVLAPDMRGYGDSDKPEGTDGYDGRALAEEFRALVRILKFGGEKPLILAAHDMGAPPALLWAADHPEEVRGLLYMEVPVMLSSVLTKIISYTPETMQKGSMWWWILPLAPGVPERLVVGREREFLTWFFTLALSQPDAIPNDAVEEYLRTFSGREGVLGAMGVYRAAFTTIAQTEPLQQNKVQTPILALGGAKSQGDKIREMVALVASHVTGHVIPDCGHFLPEEAPADIVKHIHALSAIPVRN
jgi:pimeloyl-ACP methyl ester carboxylesterase